MVAAVVSSSCVPSAGHRRLASSSKLCGDRGPVGVARAIGWHSVEDRGARRPSDWLTQGALCNGSAIVLLAAATSGASVTKRRFRRPVKPGEGIVSSQLHVPPHIVRPPYLGPGGPRSPQDGFPDHEFFQKGRIEIKDREQIERMRASCALAREALEVGGRCVGAGVTTEAIDEAVHNFIIARGAYPSPLGYMGFPKAVCTSVNNVIAHGIPDSRKLKDGDIVNVDVTLYLDGYHGDTSCTFFVGRPSRQAYELTMAAKHAMEAGIKVCGPGVDFREIGKAISKVTDQADCFCSSQLIGHGIGSYFHGSPEVIHAVNPVDQGLMQPGMTFTIEPCLVEKNESSCVLWADGWTMSTKTGAWSAQFEHTILITDNGHEMLTGPTIDSKAMAGISSSASSGRAQVQKSSGGGSSGKRGGQPGTGRRGFGQSRRRAF